MGYDIIIVGCGLTGAVAARILANRGKKVLILERRNHIGGNVYDHKAESGINVHDYGPHIFHSNDIELYKFVQQYSDWVEFRVKCGSVIEGQYTPTPFNYKTIDDFYSVDRARLIKSEIEREYKGQKFATVLELLSHSNKVIQKYAQFLFDKDYSLYTAKQWGISPMEIDKDVLKRVPIRFDYEEGYFEDLYQVVPKDSYRSFFRNLISHKNIEIILNKDALSALEIKNNTIYFAGTAFAGKVIYTGAIDELFNCRYGILPYRSLKFEWVTEDVDSFQEAPIVAYPQAKEYTRITEYSKFPGQKLEKKTTYAIEYPIPYQNGKKIEPYYPVLTERSRKLYQKYYTLAKQYDQLVLCGRLADFKYYNMDQALKRILTLLDSKEWK